MSAVVPGRCPVCGESLGEVALRRCATCDTAVHEACAEFLGGCARYACAEAATARGRVQRYLAERLVHEAITLELLAVACVAASWSLSNTVVMGLSVVLGAVALHMLAEGRRLRRVEPGPGRLVQLLKKYPPLVTEEMRAGNVALFGSVLRFAAACAAGWVALMGVTGAVLVALGLPPWELLVAFTMVATMVAGGVGALFGLAGFVMAVSGLLTGARARPRWIALADSWRDDLDAFAAPPAAHLTEGRKPPLEK